MRISFGGWPRGPFADEPTAGDLIRSVTMDVDFGIALAASDEHYGTSRWTWQASIQKRRQRLVRQHGNLNIYIDFLTEIRRHLRVSDGGRRGCSVIPGINRARRAGAPFWWKGRISLERPNVARFG